MMEYKIQDLFSFSKEELKERFVGKEVIIKKTLGTPIRGVVSALAVAAAPNKELGDNLPTGFIISGKYVDWTEDIEVSYAN